MRAALAVISVAAGVSLGVSVVIMTSSVSSGLAAYGRQLAGPAPVRVIGATSSGGLDENVLAAVQRTPGVASAIPMVQVVTFATTKAGVRTAIVALGVDCRIQALIGPLGCTPAAIAVLGRSGTPLVSATLADQLGAGASILTDSRPVSIRPTYTLSALDRFNHGRVAVFSLAAAQNLFDRNGRLDVIYVVPVRGTNLGALRSRLQANVGGWNGVLSAADPPPVVGVAIAAAVPIFALLSVFALGVGAVLIFNIMALALEERRRELAIISALGGTAGSVRAGAGAEGLLLGLAGGLLGVVGGWLLAHPLTASLSNFTRLSVGITIPVVITARAVVTGALLGAVIGAVAAVLPTRRALRMDVAAELSLRESRSEAMPQLRFRRALVFLAVCAAGMGVCWLAQRHGALEPWQASVAPFGALVATIAFLLAAGELAPLVASGASRFMRHGDGPVRLGLANLAREGRRAGVMAVAIGAAVTTAFVIGTTHRSAVAAITRSVEVGHPQEVYVSTLGPNNTANVEAKPSATLIAEISRIPGVARVDQSVFLLSGHDSGDLVGVSASDYPWLNGPLILGSDSLQSFNSGRVLVGANLARTRDLRPGTRLVLDTPTGYASVTVGGVWQDGSLNGDSVTMPMWLLQRLYGNQPPENLGLIPQAGVTTTELADRVRTADLAPRLVIETPSVFAAAIASSVNGELAPFSAMQRGLLLVAFVAVLSTLLLVGVQRRRELGVLAAVGMEPSQLAGMTLAEGASAGTIGVALSLVGSIIIAVAFSLVVPIDIGYKDPLRLDFPAFFVWAPVAVALVTAAALLPAWRNTRVPIVESLQYE